MDVDVVATEVASAVGLAEGPAGVMDVLRVISRAEPVAAREVSRLAELPVPIVAAVCNELRKRGVVDRTRPVRLTPAGRAVLALPTAGHAHLSGACPRCAGSGVAVPDVLAPLAAELERVAAGGPGAKLELDQTHCTVDSKLRRVLRMHEVPRPRGLRGGAWGPVRLGFRGDRGAGREMGVDGVARGRRPPRPATLAAEFDVACTDPPYPPAGAELFLSRAVSALADGTGRHVFFSFGARRPEETLRAQRLIADLGLTVRSLVPGFNAYSGAGILAGTSHLYHLRTTAQSRPAITGPYPGPLYTADTRAAVTRPYRCAGCGTAHQVGPGARWTAIADLKAAGCPDCGGTVLRPLALGAGSARMAAGR